MDGLKVMRRKKGWKGEIKTVMNGLKKNNGIKNEE